MDTLEVKLKNKYLIVITKHTKTLGKKVENETHSKVKEREKKKAYKMRRVQFGLQG